MEWATLIISSIGILIAVLAGWSDIRANAKAIRATLSKATATIAKSSKWGLVKLLFWFALALCIDVYFLYDRLTATGPLTRGDVFSIAIYAALPIFLVSVGFTVIAAVIVLRAAHDSDKMLLEFQVESNKGVTGALIKSVSPPAGSGEKN